jgi:ribonucleotide reductase beta subunit family protein with ferritin-like domain
MSQETVAADQISYEDLYARWERSNWRATEIDFSVDREQWRTELSDLERRAALWLYSMFFHGEHAVAGALSPYIDAAPRAEQKYFLATQQVDEARHSVLFARFMHEVAGQGEDVGSSLRGTSGGLTWGFRRVFARLDRMADELRRDRSKPMLAQAITLYHLVIEGALGQPGQHFIEESLSARSLLPGFCEGIRNVANDEQRHIAFGVKMIADLVREDPECEPAVEELLRRILPFTTAVFAPPGGDERYVTLFGFELADLYTQGAEAIQVRLRSAGLHPERMQTGLGSGSLRASSPARPDIAAR